MSHLSLKITVCAATLALFPLGYQWTANASLHSELAELRQQQDAARLLFTADASDSAPLDLVRVRAELSRMANAIKAAEARVAELDLFKERAKDELIVSLGTVESMAKGLGSILRRMTELSQKTSEYAPGSPEKKAHEAAMQEVQRSFPKVFPVLREIPRLERNPVKAARFYATLLGETSELDDETRAQLEPRLQNWITQLQHDSLALPQRPKEPADAIAAWDKRRIAAMQEVSKDLQSLVPADKADRVNLFRALLMEPDEESVREAFTIMTGAKK